MRGSISSFLFFVDFTVLTLILILILQQAKTLEQCDKHVDVNDKALIGPEAYPIVAQRVTCAQHRAMSAWRAEGRVHS